jgi:hypothetical protein
MLNPDGTSFLTASRILTDPAQVVNGINGL